MRNIFLIIFLLLTGTVNGSQKADFVLVVKSESKLYLKKNGEIFKSFDVVFGRNPKGHKQKQGDGRTPEGRYVLDYKKEDSSFYKAIHISYPNHSDKKKAQRKGVRPGGQIMIHGQKNGWGWLSFFNQCFDWTEGCIALSNGDMDIIWDTVDVGTPIKIEP